MPAVRRNALNRAEVANVNEVVMENPVPENVRPMEYAPNIGLMDHLNAIRLRRNPAKALKDVTIGADPELFIYNTKTGKVVSAIGLIPGEKGNAWVKEGWEKGFGLEIDNILAEYNIPAVTTLEDWLRVHNFMKNEIRKFVQEKNPDLDIRHRASYLVDEDQLDNEIAKLFGWKAAA